MRQFSVILLGCLPILASCSPEPPPVSRRAPLTRPTKLADDGTCLGGLLCESRETVAGFRLPRHCEPLHRSARLLVCRVEAPDLPARIDEFLTSRYPQLQRESPGIYQVQQASAVLRVRVAGDRADFSLFLAN